jgi:hypothetical protein
MPGFLTGIEPASVQNGGIARITLGEADYSA